MSLFAVPFENGHPSGAAAVFSAIDAHDARAAETQSLQRFRTQVAELLGIPANAEDAFVLNELDHLCRRVEECADHREVQRG